MRTKGHYPMVRVIPGPRETPPPPPSGGTREHGTPKAETVDWRDLGACRGKPAELWYANEPMAGGLGTASYLEGKQICHDCPVRNECLEWALDTGELWGLWGGVSPRGRAKLLRERGMKRTRRRVDHGLSW